jgi:hypothetical protein
MRGIVLVPRIVVTRPRLPNTGFNGVFADPAAAVKARAGRRP